MPRMRPVESSSVALIGYDEDRTELHIEFVGGDRYIYAMVPRSVVAALLNAESIGRFVNQNIKPRYPVRDG